MIINLYDMPKIIFSFVINWEHGNKKIGGTDFFSFNNKKFFFCRQKCGISEITKHQFFQQIIIKNH